MYHPNGLIYNLEFLHPYFLDNFGITITYSSLLTPRGKYCAQIKNLQSKLPKVINKLSLINIYFLN